MDETPTILVVEDDAVLATDLIRQVTAQGWGVVGVARDGERAVERAKETRPDLILMDVGLPGVIDGAEAAERLRREDGLFSVFLSAHTGRATILRCKRARPLGYIVKPVDPRVLAITLELALNHVRLQRAHEAEEAARRLMEHRYAQLLEHIPDPVIVLEESGRIILYNQSAERTFGYAREEILGARPEVLLPGFAELDPWEHLASVERPRLDGRRKDGASFPAEVTLSHTSTGDDGETLLTAIVRDRTVQQELEEQYAQAQKLEMMGLLGASIAHDFNNLLQALASSHYLAAMGAKTPEEMASDCRAIVRNGTALTEQLLDHVTVDEGRPEVTDASKLLPEALRVVRRVLGPHIRLHAELSPELGRVRLAPGRLEQVLLNLMLNARAAMPAGGEITVEATPRHEGSGEYVVLRIRDTGRGIPPHLLDTIFEPFFTTKPQGTGAGLGLASVRRVVRQWGGSVRVASEVGVGSTFEVTIPTTTAVARDEVEVASAVAPRGTEHIMLALSPRNAMRDGLRSILEAHGYTVQEPSFVEEVVATETTVDPPALVLADLEWPVPYLARLVERTHRRDGHVLVMRARGFDPPDLGRISTIDVPFEPAGLLRRIRAILDAQADVATRTTAP